MYLPDAERMINGWGPQVGGMAVPRAAALRDSHPGREVLDQADQALLDMLVARVDVAGRAADERMHHGVQGGPVGWIDIVIVVDGSQQCRARWSRFGRDVCSGPWFPYVAARIHPELLDAGLQGRRG